MDTHQTAANKRRQYEVLIRRQNQRLNGAWMLYGLDSEPVREAARRVKLLMDRRDREVARLY